MLGVVAIETQADLMAFYEELRVALGVGGGWGPKARAEKS